jgi:type IV pilus assembly protein PilY1
VRARWLAPLCGVLLALPGARADDTDIYSSSILPANSVPLVMFSIDNSVDAAAIYAGCAQVGSGATMCAPAQYFATNCPTCALPAATEPLTYFHVMRYAIRMVVEQQTGMKVGLLLNHRNENNCVGPRPLLPTNKDRCSNGAYIARGFKLLDRVTIAGNPLLGIPDTTVVGPNTQEFLAILDSIPLPNSSLGHAYQGKEMYFELFRYLTGQGVYNGHNGYTDYGTDNTQNLNEDRPQTDWDASVEVGGATYVSPLTADLTCTKVFAVNFLLKGSSQDDDSDAAIDSDLPGGMIGLDLRAPNNDFEHVIGYLHDIDLARPTLPFGTVPALNGKQNVTSYFFTLPTPLDSNPPRFDRTMTDYAQQGGTTRPQAFTSNPAQVVDELRSTFQQILSVSTTFVSASVPVNVFSRTQLLNDVYVALFQPDAAAKPFWAGNVKKLKTQIYEVACAADAPAGCQPTKHVRLVDALGAEAIEDDGRIRNSALTFWTDASRIAADPVRGVQAGRDGRFVNLGGAGQKIPGFITATGPGYANTEVGARQMYLYLDGGTALTPLSADLSAAVTLQTSLGAGTTAESLRILQHVRGYDSYDHDGDTVTTEVRPWLMADPLHSRPLAINYGAISGYSQTNPAIFIAVGTNDGLLHFMRNTTTAGAETGAEVWAVLPVDLLAIQKALALNTSLTTRMYGVDGAPAALIRDVDGDGTIEAADGDRVYLYFGLRRGGRAYYALDVTDPTSPQFLWRVTPTGRAWGPAAASPGGTAVTTDYAELGFTYSQPKIARVKVGVDAAGVPVVKDAVVFAGGYDPANDYLPATKTAYQSGGASAGTVNTDDTMGNAIYVVDAKTGELIWKATGPIGGVLGAASASIYRHAQLKDSIPSTVTVVDTNGDGFTDRIVVGDTGGNIWRADLGDAVGASALPVTQSQVTDDWELNLLAKLGRHAPNSGCSGIVDAATCRRNDRRFFHEPDYVLSMDEDGPFDAIVIGSGDREDPLDYGRHRSATLVETFTENVMFMLKDRVIGTYQRDDRDPAAPAYTPPLTPTAATHHLALADATNNCTQDLSIARSDCELDFDNGWFIRLLEGKGEKLLAGALTAANRIYFSTYLPPRSNEATTCGPSEGTGLFYAVGLKQATAVFNYNLTDCPSTGCTTGDAPNSARDRFDALSSAGIPAEVVYINIPDASGTEVKCALSSDLNCRSLPGATRFRTFWYKDE